MFRAKMVREHPIRPKAPEDRPRGPSPGLLDRPDELLLGHPAAPVDVEVLGHVVELLLGARFEIVVPALGCRSGPALRSTLLRGRARGFPRPVGLGGLA